MRNELAPVVTLDGLDGTGKSSVARLLSAELGAQLIRTPPAEFGPIRHLWEPADQVSANGRLAYFLSSVLYSDALVRDARKQGPVVVDRWVHSTLAYHEAIGSTLRIDIDSLGLLVPTLRIFLDCSDEVRMARLDARPGTTAADRLFSGTLGKRTRKAFEQFSMNRVDTSALTIEQTVGAIVAELQKTGAWPA